MGFLFNREKPAEEPKKKEQMYFDRRYNVYWMLALNPFRDYTAEEMQEAMNAEVKKLRRVLRTDPVDMVKVKTEAKMNKLVEISGDPEAFGRERVQAMMMFNEDMRTGNGELTTDPEKIKTAIAKIGWRDGPVLMSVEGFPQCPKCLYINPKGKKCINCDSKL